MVSPVLYEKLVNVMRNENADLVACESTRDINGLKLEMNCTDKVFHIVGFEACLEVLTNSPSCRSFTWSSCMVWNKLFKRELISALFRDDAVPAEDLLFCYEYAKNCEKMVIIPSAMYYWRPNPISVTNTFTLEKLVSQSKVWMNIADNTHYISTHLSCHLKFSAAYRAHNTLWRIVCSKKEQAFSEYIDIATVTVNRYFSELINHKDIELKVLIPACLFRYCRPLWRLATKFIQS